MRSQRRAREEEKRAVGEDERNALLSNRADVEDIIKMFYIYLLINIQAFKGRIFGYDDIELSRVTSTFLCRSHDIEVYTGSCCLAVCLSYLMLSTGVPHQRSTS